MRNDNPVSHGKVPVWDPPTRLFHWLLAILIACAWLTNRFSEVLGGFHWHKIAGYAILSLIIFRLFWGFWGGSTSRFCNFIRPMAALSYLRDLLKGKPPNYLGHNPLGTLMILALLALVSVQGVTGLLASNEDSYVSGPLAAQLSDAAAARALSMHHTIFNLILAFVVMHILANVSYSVFKRDGTLAAMVTGRKKAGDFVDGRSATFGSPVLAIVLMILAIAIVFGGVSVFGVGAFQP